MGDARMIERGGDLGTSQPSRWVCTGAAGLTTALLLVGCLAQKAELTQMERGLNARIEKLDKREKDLEANIKKAEGDLDRLVHETRAKFLNEIRELKGEDLARISGELEKESEQIKKLEGRLDDNAARLDQALAKRDADAERRFAAVEKAVADQAAAQTAALKADRERLSGEIGKLVAQLDALGGTIGKMAATVDQRLAEHDKALGEKKAQERQTAQQLTQLSQALKEFKQALTGLADEMDRREKRGNERVNELEASFSKRTDALAVKIETDAKATTAHLAEVNRSVGSVAKALEAMGGKFVAQAEEQERQLGQVSAQLHSLSQEIGELRDSRSRKGAKPERGHNGPAGRKGGEPHQPAAASQSHGGGQAEASDAVPDGSASLPVQAPSPDEPGLAKGEAAAPVAGSEAQSGQREVYDRHLQQYKQGNLAGALEGFSEFLQRYPTSDLAPNAQYWIGECYYGQKDFERAIEAFDQVVHRYPASEKVPAALLKKGITYLALKDKKRASSVLRQVVDAYPKSPEANKALDKLAQIKQGR